MLFVVFRPINVQPYEIAFVFYHLLLKDTNESKLQHILRKQPWCCVTFVGSRVKINIKSCEDLTQLGTRFMHMKVFGGESKRGLTPL